MKVDEKFKVRAVTPEEVKMAFPTNWMAIEINGEHLRITASLDAGAMDEFSIRIGILKTLLERGPLPQPKDANDEG